MDYFGPIEVTVGRRHEKRWGVIFTCLASRAVHLELASTLNTCSAIMAIRNFTNRRGPPKIIHCDNGTNFRSAEKELKLATNAIDRNQLYAQAQSNLPGTEPIKFKFSPPLSPWIGGVWERLIRSVKTVLYTILKERAPKDETLRSFLIEAENILNSRPLTYQSTNIDDPEAITPNHLLRLSNRLVYAPGVFEEEKYGRKQWRESQILADRFWKRWLLEYVPTLNKRTAWHVDSPPLKKGDVVLLMEDNPRNCWKRGIVLELHHGLDSKIRSVDIKTTNGIRTRPVRKLARLDLSIW
jgi:hypothetical protein